MTIPLALCLSAQTHCKQATDAVRPRVHTYYYGPVSRDVERPARLAYSSLITGEAFYPDTPEMPYAKWKARRVIDQRERQRNIKLPRGDGRLVFEPITQRSHAAWTIKPARYAKGKVLVVAPSMDDFHTRASRLASALGRWVNRESGYIMSPAAGERYAALYAEGYDASTITGGLYPPSTEENPL